MNPRQQEMSYCLEFRVKSKHPCVLTDILPAGIVKYINSAKFGSIQPAVNETWHNGTEDQKICPYACDLCRFTNLAMKQKTIRAFTIISSDSENKNIYNLSENTMVNSLFGSFDNMHHIPS